MSEIEDADALADRVAQAIDLKAFEPILRKASEDFYERLLNSVQDYLIDDASYNISSRLQMAERQAETRWRELCAVDAAVPWYSFAKGRVEAIQKYMADRSALYAAMTGLRDIIDRAESNASGNPEWELVSAAVNAARAAIAKAETPVDLA